MIAPIPGSVVAIKCWWGEHWGIVAGELGWLTIISNRGVTGCVTEELWDDVVGTAEWRVAEELTTGLSAYSVIGRARSRLGTRYDFWSWNCQDLVYWALGSKPQSPQRDLLVGALSLAGIAVLLGSTTKAR
jgi:hypothetical protein